MTERGGNFIIQITFDSNSLTIFCFSGIEIILFFEGLTEALMSETDEALFIAHLVDSEATHSIFASHNKFANELIVLADLHIFLSKSAAIAIHNIECSEGTMVERDGFFEIAEAEVVIG